MKPMSHEIRFVLDGEKEVTHDHQLTPNQIISDFGKKDPSTNYLIELKGNGQEKVSYQGVGDQPIRLHNNMRFQIISTGPTPVSDVAAAGLSSFVAGLRNLGYSPEIVDPSQRRIRFAYNVETGRHAGKTYNLGFDVPQDFPLTTPPGPHVEAILHQTGQSGTHPTANIHDSPFGSTWQYWSRPFPDWARSKKTVGAYMGHIFKLWDTQ